MEAQRARARAAQNFKADTQLAYEGGDTEFKGYSERQTEAKIVALYKDSEPVESLAEGDSGAVVIDFTPFYAESGGQVGDVGYIFAGENHFEVRDTQKNQSRRYRQFGVLVSGRLNVGDAVTAKIDNDIRAANMRNHSATHLMHRALREVLGEHVDIDFHKLQHIRIGKVGFDFDGMRRVYGLPDIAEKHFVHLW